MAMRKRIIVDMYDQVIGTKEKIEEVSHPDLYRVSALWITNSRGEILISQRSSSKKNAPGKWGPAVLGVVREGEDYDVNIALRMQEKLGLSGITIDKDWKRKPTEKEPFFLQWYTAKLDMPAAAFKINPAEVEQVKWVSSGDLVTYLQQDAENFVLGMTEYVHTFFLEKTNVPSSFI